MHTFPIILKHHFASSINKTDYKSFKIDCSKILCFSFQLSVRHHVHLPRVYNLKFYSFLLYKENTIDKSVIHLFVLSFCALNTSF